jgi:hypothetical protein
MRSLVGLVAASVVVVLLTTVATAEAAPRRATDSEAGIRFTLESRVLTARLLPRAPRRVRREVYGKRIRAVCGTSFVFARSVTVRHARLWPRRRARVRFRFRRNISRRARWCLLEHPAGGDVAFVSFPR